MTSDAALVAAALDAAHTLDDFVGSVVGIGGGQVGEDGHDGSESKPQAWARRLLLRSGHAYGRQHVVQGMAAMFAPEQLRKAALAAVELSSRIDDLRGGSQIVVWVANEAFELGVADFAATLSNKKVGSKSPELRDVHRRLGKVINVLNEARTRLLLLEMRAQRPGNSPE